MRKNARRLPVKILGVGTILVVAAAIAAVSLVSFGTASHPEADPPALPGDDPSLEPIPTIEFPDSAQSVFVRVLFNGPTDVEFLEGGVGLAPPPARIGDPPLIKVEVFDDTGAVVQKFDEWHPLWVDEHREDGSHGVEIQDSAEGRFVFGYAPDLETVRITDIELEQELTEINVHRIIVAYCAENGEDAGCEEVCVGDVDRDGTVTPRDVAAVASAIPSNSTDRRWNPDADINQDGQIDIHDLALVLESDCR